MTSRGEHIGIFGGSFNPPHVGHVLAVHYSLLRWKLDKVLVIPGYRHPFGKPLPAFEHRFRMCELAFEHLGDSVEVSDAEQQLGGTSYTIDTVRHLEAHHPRARFNLLVGGDILADVEKWREVDELRKLAPFLVIPRLVNGRRLSDDEGLAALPEISSSEVRQALQAGSDTGEAIPQKVLEYIRRHGMYETKTAG